VTDSSKLNSFKNGLDMTWEAGSRWGH